MRMVLCPKPGGLGIYDWIKGEVDDMRKAEVQNQIVLGLKTKRR